MTTWSFIFVFLGNAFFLVLVLLKGDKQGSTELGEWLWAVLWEPTLYSAIQTFCLWFFTCQRRTISLFCFLKGTAINHSAILYKLGFQSHCFWLEGIWTTVTVMWCLYHEFDILASPECQIYELGLSWQET